MASAKFYSSRVLAAIAALLICGCGGGGGGAGGGQGGGGNVSPPLALPTVSLTAAPDTILSGSDATLTWTSTAASACVASGAWSGSRATSGSELIAQLQDTANFTLTCSNARGEAATSAIVTVSGPPPLPLPTLTFTASPALVRRGDPVTLTWSTNDIDWCYAGWIFSGNATRPSEGVEVLTDRTEDGGMTRVFDINCGNADGVNLRRYASVDIYTFAGKLVVPGGIWSDSDVNDPDAEYLSNDATSIFIGPVGLFPGS